MLKRSSSAAKGMKKATVKAMKASSRVSSDDDEDEDEESDEEGSVTPLAMKPTKRPAAAGVSKPSQTCGSLPRLVLK